MEGGGRVRTRRPGRCRAAVQGCGLEPKLRRSHRRSHKWDGGREAEDTQVTRRVGVGVGGGGGEGGMGSRATAVREEGGGHTPLRCDRASVRRPARATAPHEVPPRVHRHATTSGTQRSTRSMGRQKQSVPAARCPWRPGAQHGVGNSYSARAHADRVDAACHAVPVALIRRLPSTSGRARTAPRARDREAPPRSSVAPPPPQRGRGARAAALLASPSGPHKRRTGRIPAHAAACTRIRRARAQPLPPPPHAALRPPTPRAHHRQHELAPVALP